MAPPSSQRGCVSRGVKSFHLRAFCRFGCRRTTYPPEEQGVTEQAAQVPGCCCRRSRCCCNLFRVLILLLVQRRAATKKPAEAHITRVLSRRLPPAMSSRLESLVDWDEVSALAKRAQRVAIQAIQTSRVKINPDSKMTVEVEQATSNEHWGPTGACAQQHVDLQQTADDMLIVAHRQGARSHRRLHLRRRRLASHHGCCLAPPRARCKEP